jgi:S1-C subfamily serine protease
MKIYSLLVSLFLLPMVSLANQESVVNLSLPGIVNSSTGWFIKPGIIVSVKHIFDHSDLINVTLFDGREYEGIVFYKDELADFALIFIEDTDVVTSNLECIRPSNNELVKAIGNPLRIRWATLNGRVATDREPEYQREKDAHNRLVILDLHTPPGMSGAPVFNEDGNVIGMIALQVVQPIGTPIGLIGVPTALSAALPGDLMCEILENFPQLNIIQKNLDL